MGALLVGSIVASLGVGVYALIAPSRPGIRRLSVGAAGFGAGALALVSAAGARVPWPYRWFPGLGEAALVPSVPVAYAVVGIYASAIVALYRHSDLPPPQARDYGSGLALLSCGLVVVAVAIDNFLLRYVALELIALVTAASLVVTLPSYHGGTSAWRSYLPWRLGDAGLLSAALLLERTSGGFGIDTALSDSLRLPTDVRSVVAVGVLLAAWVKAGVPPFHRWLVDATADARLCVGPVSSALPLLGAYLLYRSQDVIASLQVWPAVTAAAVLACAVAAWRAFCGAELSARRWWPVWHGALAFPAVALGLASWYLATFVPVRLALSAWLWRQRPQSATGCDIVRGTAYPQLPVALRCAAAMADRLDNGLETCLSGYLARFVVNVAGAAVHGLERRLDRMADVLAGGVGALSAQVQRRHTGRLRTNLLWAVFALSGVLLTALFAWRS